MNKRMTRIAAPAFLGALMLAVTASCGNAPGSAGGPAERQPLRLGAIYALSGAAQIFGASQKKGADLAVEEINAAGGIKGRPISLKVLDEASIKEQARNAMLSLVTDPDVLVVIGPTLSNDALVAVPIANAAKVPVLGVSWAIPTGITDVGPYIWRDSLSDGQNIPAAVFAAQTKLGFTKAGLLYGTDDAFTRAGRDAFQKAAAARGIDIVETQTFAQTDQDFTAQLTRLKAKKPQVLFVSALAAAAILIQARKLGLGMPIIGGNGFNSPATVKKGGAAAEGVIVGASWDASNVSVNPANKRFSAAFTAKYHTPPDQFAAQAYTGIYLVKHAIEQRGASREGVVAGFQQTKTRDTPLGTFSFTADRNAQADSVILIVKNGKFTKFDG